MSKKYFEAIGRQRWSMGLLFTNLDSRAMHKAGLPSWAIDCVQHGYVCQVPWRAAMEPMKSQMAGDSMQSELERRR